MQINRTALTRYKTIDHCLCNRERNWTLLDLMEACGRALQDEDGREEAVVSRRAIQMDLDLMRSATKGYNAPIVVVDKKYYTYEDPHFSITKIPLTAHDLSQIEQIAQLLEHFKGYEYFKEADEWVTQLKNKSLGIENIIVSPTAEESTLSDAPFSLSSVGNTSTVEFYALGDYAPELIANPLHPSQKLLNVRIDKLHHFSIEVVIDLQLERLLLSYGEFIEILAPKPLRLKLGTRIWKAGRHY
jgi:hypothetical protein